MVAIVACTTTISDNEEDTWDDDACSMGSISIGSGHCNGFHDTLIESSYEAESICELPEVESLPR